MEVLSHREQLRLRVVVVAFAPPAALQVYEGRFGLVDVPLLSDPDRSAYAAFGFGRGSFARHRAEADPFLIRTCKQYFREVQEISYSAAARYGVNLLANISADRAARGS